MQIIRFLMENIVFVVIVLGFVASLLGKLSGKQKPAGPTNPVRRQRSDDNWQDAGRRQTPQKLQTPAYNEVRAGRVSTEYGRAEMRRESDEARYRADSSLSKRANAINRTPGGGPSSPATGTLRGDDLRKAVIWSEILGPPRAKRPYRKK